MEKFLYSRSPYEHGLTEGYPWT